MFPSPSGSSWISSEHGQQNGQGQASRYPFFNAAHHRTIFHRWLQRNTPASGTSTATSKTCRAACSQHLRRPHRLYRRHLYGISQMRGEQNAQKARMTSYPMGDIIAGTTRKTSAVVRERYAALIPSAFDPFEYRSRTPEETSNGRRWLNE